MLPILAADPRCLALVPGLGAPSRPSSVSNGLKAALACPWPLQARIEDLIAENLHDNLKVRRGGGRHTREAGRVC